MKHEIKLPKSKESTKCSSKWAQKRAMQNRKPKFKILKADDMIVDTVFRKVDNIKHTIRKLECINCDIRFAKEDRLMKHFTEVHKKDYFCDVCLAMLPDKSILLSHMKAHSNQYTCTLCDYVSKKGHQRRKHLIKIHQQIFQCVKCELKFPSRVDFYQHFKEWHEKFTCDYCGITFKMKYCIKDHIRKKHSPFECKPCNKRFARYNGLWLHNKVRHGPPAAAAYCVECDKRYPDAYRYKWHLANSIRHKPRRKVRVPCPDCGKVFSKKIYMKDHYNLVHLKQYKYRCEDCNKNFVRNADLVKHKRRIHDGILPPKNKICYMCGRGFTTNKILTNHLRTHTGERPFACVSCPARFAQRAALAGHVRALHHSCA